MSTIFYDKLAPALTTYGKTVTWYTFSSKTYDRTTGGVTTNTEVQVQAKVSPPMPLEVAQTDGVTLKVGDVVFYQLAEGLAYTPDVTWQVAIDGVKWSVVAVDRLNYGDTLVAYKITARR